MLHHAKVCDEALLCGDVLRNLVRDGSVPARYHWLFFGDEINLLKVVSFGLAIAVVIDLNPSRVSH